MGSRRRGAESAVAGLALLLLGACSTTRLYPPLEGGEAGAAASLRIVSLNIRYDTPYDREHLWDERRDALVHVLLRRSPDLVALQEVASARDRSSFGAPRQLPDLVGAMEGYAPVLEPEACRITEFLPIFIRRSSLELERSGCFFLSPHPEDPESIAWGARLPRHCLWARLRVRATQQSFYLFNVHLSHRSAEARERSVELLLRRTAEINDEGHPVVLVGDFNARPASGCIAALKGHGFRDAHAGFAGGTAHGFSGIPFGPRLDYIFVSGSLRVRSATIDRSLYRGRLPSDHFPVLADVAW